MPGQQLVRTCASVRRARRPAPAATGPAMRSAPRAQCQGDKPSVRSANVRPWPASTADTGAAPIDINRSSTRLIAPPVNTKEDPDSEGGGEEKTGREVGCRALLSRARYVAGETQPVVGVSPGQPEVTTTSERVFGTDHSEGFDRIADEPSGRVACDSVDIRYPWEPRWPELGWWWKNRVRESCPPALRRRRST